jgi:hypothetical protein
MAVALRIVLWTFISFPLWLLLSAVLTDLRFPLPKVCAAVLAWVGAGLLLAWGLPLLGHHLALPWTFAHAQP